MPLLIQSPQTIAEALELRSAQRILPTALRTQLMQRIEPQVLARSFFSAGVTQAEFLEEFASMVDAILSNRGVAAGGTSFASARADLQGFLARAGYKAPPNLAGGLRDLRSSRRLDLILRTNVDMATGYGQWKQGMDPDVLDAFPAQQLVRQRRSVEQRDWQARWREAGGPAAAYPRMIALKTDPIWRTISRFGHPYPPFDFGSGMGVNDVDRDEAERLGLIAPDAFVEPEDDPGLNDELESRPRLTDAAIKAAVSRALGSIAEWNGDTLVFKGGAA